MEFLLISGDFRQDINKKPMVLFNSTDTGLHGKAT